MEWQTIDSAPKDGTVIDVWLGNADSDDVAFYCGPSGSRRAADWVWTGGKFRPAMGIRVPVSVQPTHWRRLPEPPR